MAEPKFLDHPSKCDGPLLPFGHKPIYIALNLMFFSFWARCEGCGAVGYIDVACSRLNDEITNICEQEIQKYFGKPIWEKDQDRYVYLDSDRSVAVKKIKPG